jgi:predicted ArsR family transcriptional regulator
MLDQAPPGALAQPTRARLFALLGQLGRPAGTVELAGRLGLHPNGVRLHLERLRSEGLVLRSSDPRPRGRPRDSWQIAPDARPGGRPPRAYGDLVRWLARAVDASGRALARIETAGRQIGRELARDREDDGMDGFHSALSALGFQPEATAAPGAVTFRLRNCPYCDAVRENQPVVCTLHRGITRGLLEELMPAGGLARFEPHEPVRAGCEIEITACGGSSQGVGSARR